MLNQYNVWITEKKTGLTVLHHSNTVPRQEYTFFKLELGNGEVEFIHKDEIASLRVERNI